MIQKTPAVRIFKHGKAGFTLLEVLIVMIVIGLLAAIAIPSYTHHIRKAKQVEAKTNLSSIALLLEEYNSLYGRYCPACLPTAAAQNFVYQEDNAGAVTANSITNWLDVRPKQAASGAAVCYNYNILATTNTFTLTAAPIASRGALAGNLTIDENGAKTNGNITGW